VASRVGSSDFDSPIEPRFAFDTQHGLQLQRGRNLVQAAVVLAFAVAGAILGFLATDDHPEIAAIGCAVLGMAVGTLLSGVALLFIPPPPAMLTLGEIEQRYRRLNRRWQIDVVAFLALIAGGPFLVPLLEAKGGAWGFIAILAYICTLVGLCASAKALGFRLRDWKCPHCGRLVSECRFRHSVSGETADERG